MALLKKPSIAIKKFSDRSAQVALLLLACLSLGFLGGWVGNRSYDQQTSSQTKQQVVLKESELISDIAKKVGPSVVSVNVTTQSAVSRYYGGGADQRGAGTGVILNSDGVIMTNRHVVPSGTTNVTVTLSDGTTLEKVHVIGRTGEGDSLDVAFLKVDDKKGKTLQPATIGDSSKVQVGDRVVAIGNALGQFQNTVTSGIISGFGRNIEAGDQSGQSSETLQNLFQTDAAINSGNSGGPLVNSNSEVIGLNTAVAGGAQNVGFAIPINDLKGLIKGVLNEGKLVRPYLGVHYIPLTDDTAYQLNLPVKRGAYVLGDTGQAAVVEGSPAQKAGLQEKDIIVKVDGTAIDENNSLTSLLGKHNVGDTVSLTVNRDSKDREVKATLEEAPTN